MQEVKVIASLESKFKSTNRIYDIGGSSTLSTMQGGNQESKIFEEKIPCKLNKMPEGHLDSLDNAKICDIDTPTASTVTARYYKGIGAHKDNMCIVAMRGRNPDNPSDRTVGSPTEQRLEVNTQGMSNCLTSVQKDNMVLEKPLLLGGVGKENEFGSQYRQGNRVYSSNACAMALNAQPVGNTGGNSYLYNVGYRIRKLTPRECGRLMGVSDEDIDKMAAVNSNTQLYKQFGNSIVVDVMCAMFRNLNIEQE
uniref:Cytosine specific methyltransferase n=1 Tax=Siphoviridae sp. ct7EW56 TaxID=2827562 RepID=A0A8S5LRS6_9CAUD|nr:MAG TPA: Cytosine specific methyltransferase [Siphoviridae sp. ct7EW56]